MQQLSDWCYRHVRVHTRDAGDPGSSRYISCERLAYSGSASLVLSRKSIIDLRNLPNKVFMKPNILLCKVNLFQGRTFE